MSGPSVRLDDTFISPRQRAKYPQLNTCKPHYRRNVACHRSEPALNVFHLVSTAQSTASTSISALPLPSLTALSDFPTFPSKPATSLISTSPASSTALLLAYPTFLSTFFAFFLDSGAAFLIAWLVRGVGFAILFSARRWVCCRLLLRVRAVLGLSEVGVLGLDREGIVGGCLQGGRGRRAAGRLLVRLLLNDCV